MSAAPSVEAAFFPLDKELQVPAGHLLPHAYQVLVRLSSELPFARAARHLQEILGVQVHASTARRFTLAVGKRSLEMQTRQAAPLAVCQEEAASERMAMSSDGAMVPLLGGGWGEVKLVAIGTVEREKHKTRGEEQIVTRNITYFARRSDAATFADQASGEIRRRGVERAGKVCAIQDGAEWLQGFVQTHRQDALRILDFAHAAGRFSQIAQQITAAGGHLPASWLDGVLHRLKDEGPERVLHHVSRLARRYPQAQEDVDYLQKRRGQMDYPRYQQQGWPIGSGTVECGHKLVMQARLKGPGMHWHPDHVNPMLALRLALCNDRWQENWQAQQRLEDEQQQLHRRTPQQQRFQRKQATQQAATALESSVSPPSKPTREKTGRTPAQYRWGRQTFSHRRLQQANGAK